MHDTNLNDLFLTRREVLKRCGTGIASLGLASLLAQTEQAMGSSDEGLGILNPRTQPKPHFAPRAKAVIHIFLNGGPSHVDTFDPKPELTRLHGKMLPVDNLKTERKTGAAFRSPFKFERRGQSGIEVSELFKHVGDAIDDICVIRSMHGDSPNHEPSLMLMNCGEPRLVRPSFGSWLNYGLGSENENLPAFIAMCPGGYPIKGVQNWQSAFLPGAFQGTYIDTQHTQVDKLLEYIRSKSIPRAEQRRQLDVLSELNRIHQERRQRESDLEARIQSFELAYRMQTEATDAFDISKEPESVRKQYGEGTQARQLLIARRLVERGVRFVQVWHGAGQPWDNHDDIETGHRRLAGQCDRAIGALLRDLKERGLLDETLVLWGGEFGRTPTVELPSPGANQGKTNGRDHNNHGFTVWLAGGGVRGGHVHGATDEFGFKAVEDRVHVHDLHATMLHLLGINHERLTFRFAGRDFRFTDVHGRIVEKILA
jgi:hypothetical protein